MTDWAGSDCSPEAPKRRTLDEIATSLLAKLGMDNDHMRVQLYAQSFIVAALREAADAGREEASEDIDCTVVQAQKEARDARDAEWEQVTGWRREAMQAWLDSRKDKA